MKFRLIPVFVAAAFALSGCATTPPERIDLRKAFLMPKEDAHAVFQRYGVGGWAENPYLVRSKLCGAEKITVRFDQIDQVQYSVRMKRLIFSRSIRERGALCVQDIAFTEIDPDAARELILAARALGMRISEYRGLPPQQKIEDRR
ncbi:MAG: hypothetical protein LBM17_06985 [Candidatus Accumulibacter sp.]|jgi:hypothetical protein|nr:hypothetical protein [Accumulibacter sp.]